MDAHVQNWQDNENVFYFVALADIGQPYTCAQWGNNGISGLPVIVEDTGTIFGWLHDSWNAYPSYTVIDHEMRIADKPWPYGSTDNLVQALYNVCEDAGLCGNPDSDSDGLANAEDNCPFDYNPEQLDDDEDGIGDECDNCHNYTGDLNDDILININDIIILVNMILNGGYDSPMHDDCEKADGDFNSDGIINVLDVIQVVNIILGNTSPGYGAEELDKNDAKAVIYFNAANTDLFVTISVEQMIVGIEFNYPGNQKSVELIDNSHIILEQNNLNDHNIVLAYSLLNTPFDSKTITFLIRDGASITPQNIDWVIGDKNGIALELIKSTDTGIFQNGPYEFTLSGVYPNPFNPVTEVSFTLPFDGNINLNAFNLQGQEVDIIFEGYQTVGVHTYSWDASTFPSGVYYIRLSDGVNQAFEKAILLK